MPLDVNITNSANDPMIVQLWYYRSGNLSTSLLLYQWRNTSNQHQTFDLSNITFPSTESYDFILSYNLNILPAAGAIHQSYTFSATIE